MQIVDNFKELVLNEVPLIDVRAPVEFAKGTILNAVNLPLMDNDERHEVGICYKKHGQQSAIDLGHHLVSGKIKAQRIQDWCDYFDAHPNTHILCFRGGLRSKTSQQWIVETGREIPLVKGGYKAFRNYLIQATESIVENTPLWLVSGKTGSGKTEVLEALGDTLDLEGLANHRGSSFGKNISPQPGQIDFENAVAKRLLQLIDANKRTIILEDESRIIGRCALPLKLHEKMAQSKVYLLEDEFDQRVERILQCYVVDMLERFTKVFGEQGFDKLSTHLHNAFHGIRRRLGDKRHKELLQVLDDALQRQLSTNDPSGHMHWIEVLLNEYYDPLYEYQLGKKQDRIVFRGNKAQVIEALSKDTQLNG